jgi:hypothetical protein
VTRNALKPRSIVFALLALALMPWLLTGCAINSRDESASRRLYQPATLLLKAGQPVQTPDGIYTPQSDEVWHSHKRFVDLERKFIDASSALAQERSRR